MRRLLVFGAALLVVLAASFSVAAKAPSVACATIQGGTITDSMGNPIGTGYDQFGYNYQAHLFNGTYDSSDRVLDGMYLGNPAYNDFADDSLMMKWSDPWIANVDCTGDGKLDRGLVNGVASGISMGWLTNQVNGDYTDVNGDQQHYTLFDKIVWVGPGGPLWGQYMIAQEVYNDPAGGFHGLQFKIAAPGFGQNDHWTTI